MTGAPPTGVSISSTILNSEGAPLAGATVRIRATTNETKTDGEGRFVLVNLEEGKAVSISTWKESYYCAKADGVIPPASEIKLTYT